MDTLDLFPTKVIMNEKKLGILGGGQLSKMLVSSALKLNISTVVLDKQNSCGMVSDYVIGIL